MVNVIGGKLGLVSDILYSFRPFVFLSAIMDYYGLGQGFGLDKELFESGIVLTDINQAIYSTLVVQYDLPQLRFRLRL